MGNQLLGDSPLGSKQSKSQIDKATISLVDSDDEDNHMGSYQIPRKKTLKKNNPNSITGSRPANTGTPHFHSLHDEHSKLPGTLSNFSEISSQTEVADEGLSDGEKCSSFRSHAKKSTSFHLHSKNLSNDKGTN